MIRNEAKKRSKIQRSTLVLLGVLALVIVLTLTVLSLTGKIHFFGGEDSSKNTAQTTSKVPSAQSDFSGGSERSTATTNKTEGIVEDTQGNSTVDTSSEQWTKSQDGSLVVYAPYSSKLLASGDILSGVSNGSRVSYRLIDNISGQIAQGSLQVVNGRFSGVFEFSTKATEGQVDVFNQASDGTETNNVSIPVRFTAP